MYVCMYVCMFTDGLLSIGLSSFRYGAYPSVHYRGQLLSLRSLMLWHWTLHVIGSFSDQRFIFIVPHVIMLHLKFHILIQHYCNTTYHNDKPSFIDKNHHTFAKNYISFSLTTLNYMTAQKKL